MRFCSGIVSSVLMVLLCMTLPSIAASIEGLDEWPARIAVPNVTTPADTEVLGGFPSSDRKIVGISFLREGKRYVCSGLFIHARFVLTAAHCTCSASDFRVTNAGFGDGKWFRAEFASRFRSYDCLSNSVYGDDLALLRLPMGLPSSAGLPTCNKYSLIGLIKLGAFWVSASSMRVHVAGYGFVGDDPNSIGTRRETIVGINSFLCEGQTARSLGCFPLGEFIAGANRTDGDIRDTCAGDSGGPAFFRDGDTLIPIGVVSRGLPVGQLFPKRGECGSGGIYTHLGRKDVLEWMKWVGVTEGSPTCSAAQ
jgi:Trypsin